MECVTYHFPDSQRGEGCVKDVVFVEEVREDVGGRREKGFAAEIGEEAGAVEVVGSGAEEVGVGPSGEVVEVAVAMMARVCEWGRPWRDCDGGMDRVVRMKRMCWSGT